MQCWKPMKGLLYRQTFGNVALTHLRPRINANKRESIPCACVVRLRKFVWVVEPGIESRESRSRRVGTHLSPLRAA